MDSKTLRFKRENFRLSHSHKHLPEVPLIASKESTAMFNVAGMQQLVPYLAGKTHSLGQRLFNIQKCIRTNDIDEVWDASHCTFFEMMGNRSLWNYFKKESVQYSYDFLVEELGFDPRKLAVTIFEWNTDAPRDEETSEYRKKAGIKEDKISFLWAKNNRRSPGPIWPCGPDTEIFYRVWDSEYPPKESNVKDDEDNRLEIWNNVFMEYYRDESWKLTKLKNQNVDTWMWLERMCAVLQNKESIFDTDVFKPIVNSIEKNTWLSYIWNERRFRIVADHIRTAIMLINDWVISSNIWPWYVLRMIIRRMYYNLILLKEMPEKELQVLLSECVAFVSSIYEIKKSEVKHSLINEINVFKQTITRWLKILGDKIEKLDNNSALDCKDIFFLYDTCGFPLELTKEICWEKNITIDEDWFHKELENQKERSRKSTKFQKDIDRSQYLEGIPQTEFIGYTLSDCESENYLSSWAKSKDLKFLNIKLLKDFEINWQRVFIFDKTPFYAESGWQKGDSGNVELDNWEKVKIKDVQKYEWVFLHLLD